MDRIEVFLVVIAWELAAIVLTTAGMPGNFVVLPPLFLFFALPIYLVGMIFVDNVSQQTLTRLLRLQ
ncbi:hypothetical protein ACFQO4_06650 [Saliphagus sp. GCM10025334]